MAGAAHGIIRRPPSYPDFLEGNDWTPKLLPANQLWLALSDVTTLSAFFSTITEQEVPAYADVIQKIVKKLKVDPTELPSTNAVYRTTKVARKHLLTETLSAELKSKYELHPNLAAFADAVIEISIKYYEGYEYPAKSTIPLALQTFQDPSVRQKFLNYLRERIASYISCINKKLPCLSLKEALAKVETIAELIGSVENESSADKPIEAQLLELVNSAVAAFKTNLDLALARRHHSLSRENEILSSVSAAFSHFDSVKEAVDCAQTELYPYFLRNIPLLTCLSSTESPEFYLAQLIETTQVLCSNNNLGLKGFVEGLDKVFIESLGIRGSLKESGKKSFLFKIQKRIFALVFGSTLKHFEMSMRSQLVNLDTQKDLYARLSDHLARFSEILGISFEVKLKMVTMNDRLFQLLCQIIESLWKCDQKTLFERFERFVLNHSQDDLEAFTAWIEKGVEIGLIFIVPDPDPYCIYAQYLKSK